MAVLDRLYFCAAYNLNSLHYDGLYHESVHIDTVVWNWNCPFCILRGCQTKFPQDDVFLSSKIILILANSADPDEMPPYVAFHLGLHCLI